MIALKPFIFAVAMMFTSAPVAFAAPHAEAFTIKFAYDHEAPAAENYAAFVRKARKACQETATRTLDARAREDACIKNALDSFVQKLGRDDVAAVHFDRTGRLVDSSRSLAAR